MHLTCFVFDRDNIELKSRVGTQEKELKNKEKKLSEKEKQLREHDATNQTLTVTITSLQSELKTSAKEVKR